MMNYVQEGRHITVAAAPYALTSGDGALVGNLFGVAAGDAESGAEVVLGVVGVYSLAKVSALAIAVGDPIYWDDSAKLVTTDGTAGANSLIGVAVTAADNPSATVQVRLNGAGGATDVPAAFSDLTAAINADGDGDAVVANHLIVPSDAPAAANSTGKAGTIAWENGFLYVCVATDTWQRVAIATWP
jgi:predicted RecA/RadA family phage recombinase